MNQSKYQANNCSIHHITDSPPYQHIIYIFIATRVLLNSSKFEQYYLESQDAHAVCMYRDMNSFKIQFEY